MFGSGPNSDLLAGNSNPLDGSRRLEVPLDGSRMLEIPPTTAELVNPSQSCFTAQLASAPQRPAGSKRRFQQPTSQAQCCRPAGQMFFRMLHIRPAFPENRQARPDRPAGSSLKGSIACGRWVTERHHAMHFMGCAQTCRSSGYSNETAKYFLEVLYQWDGAGPDVTQPFSVAVSTGSSVCLASQRASSSSAPWTSWPAPTVLDKL